ncbi:MAG TPA: integrase arm-type DNA-binding domain-containing protein [Xanthobacteraceae bacterium]|jgi:integrase
MAARGIHKLTGKKIARLTKPGRYSDGGGLYLQVEPGGTKNFIQRVSRDGRDTIIGLGKDLAAARDKSERIRALVAEGRDPRAASEVKAAANSITFAEAARRYATKFKVKWKNPVHRNQWFKHMLGEDENGNKVEAEHNYCKLLHRLDVRDIHLAEIEAVLQPIWQDKAETARRIRGRLQKVLAWTITHKYRTGDNPARWKGWLETVLPPQKGKVQHYATLPHTDMPDFMARLKRQDGVSALALVFKILTIIRTSSIIGIAGRVDEDGEIDTPALDWKHIDLSQRLLVLERVKNDDTHFVIPLSSPAMDILSHMRRVTGGTGLVFPSSVYKPGVPLSNNAMRSVLIRMGVKATPHALARATFATWAREETTHGEDVIKCALSHGKKDKLGAAYHRGQLLQKRRALMDDWATYLLGKSGVDNAMAA